MRLPNWIRQMIGATNKHVRRHQWSSLAFESLEDRTAPAVAFAVNTVDDTPDAMVGDGIAQDAAGNTSFRAAIQEGNASQDNDVTISFNLPSQSTINLASALPDLANGFTINGPGVSDLTISRNAAIDFRILTTRFTSIVIRDLSITNGKATGMDSAGAGGGIANFGTLALSGVAFYDNHAIDRGGAIFNAGNNLTVEGCSIYHNSADRGGGIWNQSQASIQLGTHIAANSAASGGGIYNHSGGSLEINTGTQIYANFATGVGGLFVGVGGGIANFGTLTMSDVLLTHNSSVAEGGGLFTNGNATLTNVIIQFNQATDPIWGRAGGIYVRGGTTTLVSGCTVSENWAAWDTQVQENGWGISWATGATLIANVLQNNIVDSIAFDPNSR